VSGPLSDAAEVDVLLYGPGDAGVTGVVRSELLWKTSRVTRCPPDPAPYVLGKELGPVPPRVPAGPCASSRVDPDAWFPMTWDVAMARDQAAHAIAVCARCPVRPDCLELSLRHAFGVGSHGVWGGLVEEERRAIRRAWLAGTSVTEFLQEQPARLRRDQQMALHRGHPRRRRGCGPSCGRPLQRVHVPAELGGVIRYLGPDVPGVYLRLCA
jgi:WhiB family transcriptional regulator, redox-sensing transcriptional regulator